MVQYFALLDSCLRYLNKGECTVLGQDRKSDYFCTLVGDLSIQFHLGALIHFNPLPLSLSSDMVKHLDQL